MSKVNKEPRDSKLSFGSFTFQFCINSRFQMQVYQIFDANH